MNRIAPTIAVLLLVGLAVPAAACSGIKLLDDGTSTEPAATSDAGDGGDARPAPVVSLTRCLQDNNSGVVLCKEFSVCPAAPVDSRDFGACGYFDRGGTYTLECLCNVEYLCSMGSVNTCAGAKALLANVSYQQVCNQIGGTSCVQLPKAGTSSGTTSGGSSGSSGTKPGCDRDCARSCGGSRSCLDVCGC
jgi:hypothetical protein